MSSLESCLEKIKELQKDISQLNEKLEVANNELRQLKQNESKFRNVVEASPNGFILVDTNGIIALVNKKTESMFGYQRDELLGKKVEILIPIVHRGNHEHYRNEFFNEPVTRPMGAGRDLFGLHKDGSDIPVEIGLNPIKTSEGNFVIASIIDITKRKQDEAALKESEERLKIVLENMPVMMRAFDTKGNLVVWNSECQKVSGYSVEEMIETPDPMELLFPDEEYREQVRRDWYGSGDDYYQKEWKIRNKDGTSRFVSWSNISGKLPVPGWSAWTIGLDITDRKKAEAAFRESEQRVQAILDNAAIGIAEVNRDDRFVILNNRICQILGYPREELLGKAVSEITLPEDIPHGLETSKKIYDGDLDVADCEIRFIKHDRSILWVHLSISAVHDMQNRHISSIYTIEDITSRKKTEQEIKQKNEELTRFIYTVSHDLKSPLITIKSFSSYLKEDVESMDKASQEKDISYIQNAADKMGRLLDELLELSRIGRKEDPKTEVSLQSIAQAAIDLVAGRIRMRQIDVVITGPPVMLYGHEQRLIQLFQNLIDNAAKFMGNQPDPLIEIGSYVVKNKNLVVLFVRDNGVGIDPKYHHKLFGLFEKLDARSEGTGIGLALIKRITEVHNGSICLDSAGEDKGTTFYFTLDGAYVLDEVE